VIFESSRFVCFVIYEGDEPVAAMFSHVNSWWINDLLVIDELFVSTTKQGKGYGQALMNSAREFSKHNGIGSINLITHKYMPAMSFYEKNMFLQAEQYVLMFKEN
ncbi:MAG: GNAT family N-acetyltransferase, partial [Daejeonella sp.]